MSQITIQYAADKKLAPAKTQISKWVTQALAGRASKASVTIRIVKTDEMTTLNHTYRHKNKPTNVLSFPAALPNEIAAAYPELGDIVICAEVVNREANEQHKSRESHWAHMVVHGIFHLLGYDHEKDEEARVMENMEIDVMHKLGFSNPYEDGEYISHHE